VRIVEGNSLGKGWEVDIINVVCDTCMTFSSSSSILMKSEMLYCNFIHCHFSENFIHFLSANQWCGD